jgi:hemoglobin-like flavoprotein
VGYGAKPEHYGAVGAALLDTFGLHLGEAWTPEVKEAWVEAYGAISSLMLEGANGHPG